MKFEDYKEQIDKALAEITPAQFIKGLEKQGCEFGDLDENDNIIDGRSEEEKAIELINTIASAAYELSVKDLSNPKVREALQNLQNNKAVLSTIIDYKD